MSRLARAEPLESAATAYGEAMKRQPLVEGWTRQHGRRPVPALPWWWREGRVWPKAHPFQRHKGCACAPRPVLARNIQIHRIHKETRTQCKNSKLKTRPSATPWTTRKESPMTIWKRRKQRRPKRKPRPRPSPRSYVEELRQENGKYRQRAQRADLAQRLHMELGPRHRQASVLSREFCSDRWRGVRGFRPRSWSRRRVSGRVPGGDPVADVLLQGLDGSVDASAYLLVGQFGEPSLDQVQPGRPGGGEVQVEAGMGQQPLLDDGVLWVA